MKDYQAASTANKELSNRRSKESSLKKPQKFTKKSLSAAFASAAGDASMEPTSDSIEEFSPISDVFDSKSHRDSVENVVVALNQPLSSSSETITPSDFTNGDSCNVSVDWSRNSEFNNSKIRSVEVEMVVDHLEQARIQVLSSKDVDQETKKLLDALINTLMKEFYSLPDEKDRVDQLISARVRIIVLCFLLCMVIFAMVFVFGSVDQSSFHPPPT
ncbi:hypothetical protein Ancab_012972 [Ancistrocladus abbreviatus]